MRMLSLLACAMAMAMAEEASSAMQPEDQLKSAQQREDEEEESDSYWASLGQWGKEWGDLANGEMVNHLGGRLLKASTAAADVAGKASVAAADAICRASTAASGAAGKVSEAAAGAACKATEAGSTAAEAIMNGGSKLAEATKAAPSSITEAVSSTASAAAGKVSSAAAGAADKAAAAATAAANASASFISSMPKDMLGGIDMVVFNQASAILSTLPLVLAGQLKQLSGLDISPQEAITAIGDIFGAITLLVSVLFCFTYLPTSVAWSFILPLVGCWTLGGMLGFFRFLLFILIFFFRQPYMAIAALFGSWALWRTISAKARTKCLKPKLEAKTDPALLSRLTKLEKKMDSVLLLEKKLNLILHHVTVLDSRPLPLKPWKLPSEVPQ